MVIFALLFGSSAKEYRSFCLELPVQTASESIFFGSAVIVEVLRRANPFVDIIT